MTFLGADDALEAVLARVSALSGERVAIASAHGRVLADDAVSLVDLPPFDSSAMDGFAVRAEDTPGQLRLEGTSAAGRPFDGAFAAQAAVSISTGAVVPDGANAVVPVERSVVSGDAVVVEGVAPGQFVRRRGGDADAGAIVASAGSRLTAWTVAALAAAGVAEVECVRRPRVTVLSTGTELRSPGELLGPGQIYESNTFLLRALVETAGGDVVRIDAVDDDAARTRSALESGLAADVLVTTGGVSVGEHDLVRPALAALGVEEIFWRVAVKPGKPIAFGVRDATLVFGLPGNPVSALVGFELFVRPALLALQGATAARPSWRTGRLVAGVAREPGRDQLIRARPLEQDDAVLLDPISGQESHMIARAAAARVLVLVPRGEGELAAGSLARYLAPYDA